MLAYRGDNSGVYKYANDLNDLWEDFYNGKGGPKSLYKDLMTTAERQALIFASNSYWDDTSNLFLVYHDELEEEPMLLSLEEYVPELFSADDEIVVVDHMTGEVHSIDITIGIKDKFLTFVILKKLELDYKNLL